MSKVIINKWFFTQQRNPPIVVLKCKRSKLFYHILLQLFYARPIILLAHFWQQEGHIRLHFVYIKPVTTQADLKIKQLGF